MSTRSWHVGRWRGCRGRVANIGDRGRAENALPLAEELAAMLLQLMPQLHLVVDYVGYGPLVLLEGLVQSVDRLEAGRALKVHHEIVGGDAVTGGQRVQGFGPLDMAQLHEGRVLVRKERAELALDLELRSGLRQGRRLDESFLVVGRGSFGKLSG